MKKKFFRKMDAFETIMFVFVLIYVVSIIFLLIFGVQIALKSTNELDNGNFFGWPEAGLQFQHFTDIFRIFAVRKQLRYVYIEEMLWNSLSYSVVVSLFTIATQVIVAYAVSKYSFRLKSIYYNVAIIVMLVPIVGALPSQMAFAETLHLKNSIIGVAIMKCQYTGLYFLVFCAMFAGISWTYAEAAQIDGAGHFQIFIRIMLPMVKSTLFAVFILQFIVNWNDYYTPMLFIPDKTTIAYGLFTFQSLTGTHMGGYVYKQHHIAAALLTCIPIVIIFVVLRNKIMGNVTAGGIKG